MGRVLDVTVTTTVARPREAVSAFAGDPGNAPAWYAAIASVEWQTPPPLAVGSRLAFVARFLGRTLRYTYEVLELVPGRRLVMATSAGPFPMETTYEWADAPGGGTVMSLRNRGRPAGFPALLAPLTAVAVRRATRGDLARLTRLLEAGGPPG